MDNEQERPKVWYTPKGKLIYPHLNTPDKFEGKENYVTEIALDPSDPEVEKWLESLRRAIGKSKAPIKEDDKGRIIIKVKRRSDKGLPKFFADTKEGERVELEDAPERIAGDTEASLSFTVYDYTVGKKTGKGFGLIGITIHKLKQQEAKEKTVRRKLSAKDVFGE